MPMPPGRNNSHTEACHAPQKRRDIGGSFEASGDDEDDRPDNRRSRKKIDPQNGGDFGEKDVPDELEGVMAGLVPAIHVVRRIECS